MADERIVLRHPSRHGLVLGRRQVRRLGPDDDEPHRGPRDGHVEPLRLEQEASHGLHEHGVAGGEREDDQLALLALHALHRVGHHGPRRHWAQAPGQALAHQPALGTVRHHDADVLRGQATRHGRGAQLRHQFGIARVARAGRAVLRGDEHGAGRRVEHLCPPGRHRVQPQLPLAVRPGGLEFPVVVGAAGPLGQPAVQAVGLVQHHRVLGRTRRQRGEDRERVRRQDGARQQHRRQLPWVADEDEAVAAAHGHQRQRHGDLAGLVEQDGVEAVVLHAPAGGGKRRGPTT